MHSPTCVRCGQPVDDGTAYACATCVQRLAADLDDIQAYADDAQDAADGLARYATTSGGGGSDGDPAPGDLGAGAIVAQATATATSWARHLGEVRGLRLDGPRPVAGPTCHVGCRHRSCATARGRRREHPAAYAARILAAPAHLRWLRHRPEVDEVLDGIAGAARDLARAADRPPELVLLGVCGCGNWVYARRGDAYARCRGCGTAYHVGRSQDILRKAMDDQLLTAAQIATLAARIGHNRRKARNLVTVWGARGQLVVRDHDGPDGAPRYRLGDALARLARHAVTPSEMAG